MEVRLRIYKNKKLAISMSAIGIVLLVFGCVFLFFILDNFGRWVGVSLVLIGLAVILRTLADISQPIIVADTAGVTLDISILSSVIFIP